MAIKLFKLKVLNFNKNKSEVYWDITVHKDNVI